MDRRLTWFCLALLPVLIWSWWEPLDRTTWWLEAAPVLLGVPLMLAFQRRFPLSTLLLALLWVHCLILLAGGHYSYAQVPLGEWAKDWFGWSRNNYDKLGHFFQGFVPAILAREILIRTSPLGFCRGNQTPMERGAPARRMASRWLGFLCACVCLAFSAFYELIEWWVAAVSGEAADAFLGTQGYVWDTQSDMLLALVGATAALLLLSRWHDRSLRALGTQPRPNPE